MREGMLALQRKFWFIGDIRGRGLLQGMEIISDPITKTQGAEWGMAIARKVQEMGISVQVVAHGGCGVFRMAPPITITEEEMDQALQILEIACQFVMDTQVDKSVVDVSKVDPGIVEGPRL